MKRVPAIRPGLRGRLLLSVLVTIALVLVVLTAGFNIVLASRLSADADGVVSARAASELAALRVSHGKILLPEAPDQGSPDTSIWVFQGQRSIEAPQSPGVSEQLVARLAAEAPRGQSLPHPRLRLLSLPVEQGGRRIGAVVAGVSLAPYEQTRLTALIGSMVLALVAFITVGLGGNWLIRRALGPVTRMTRQAAEWSENDIDRRFNLGAPVDEFTLLAATLDRLLDRLAASLRHEQRLSAELSHELRTPLATIAAQAQYALRHTPQPSEGRAALEQILTVTRRMTRTLDTLIAAARAQLDPQRTTSDAGEAARAAAGAHATLASERGLEIWVRPLGGPVRVAAEQHLVERVLSPLIENACRHAVQLIQIELDQGPATVRVTITDDGLGVAADQLEAIFEPGSQAQQPSPSPVAVKGAGLGLALARRLARSAGGDVRAQAGGSGGRFTVELPKGGG